jgi:glycine dehydrogenase subunit 2
VVTRSDGSLALNYDEPDSIGYVAPFYGNFLILVRAYSYILHLGAEGLVQVSENAVLNANYLLSLLSEHYTPGCDYSNLCMHEFVLSADKQKQAGVSALDLAKALIDLGFHPPTVYFPLIVREALMIEPTETESKETLDRFAEVLIGLAEKAETDPESFADLPKTTPVGRLDEVKAVKEMNLCSQC